jgi:hypothetical protein
MTLPKSHKNPMAAHAEHAQVRSNAPIGSTYGQEKGDHPNRKVSDARGPYGGGRYGWEAMDKHEAQLKDAASQKLATENQRVKESDRRGPYGGGRY